MPHQRGSSGKCGSMSLAIDRGTRRSRSISLRENHYAVRPHAHIRVEVEPVCTARSGRRIEAVAILEAGIVHVRSAVESYVPQALPRKADVQIGLGIVR